MTGRCAHCRSKTMALPGAQEQFSRALPPPGWRLGWVVEKFATSKLVCYECVRAVLHAAA